MQQILFVLLIASAWSYGHAQSSLPPCPADMVGLWTNCTGTYQFSDGAKYSGEWKDGKFGGQGTFTYKDGRQRVGVFRGFNVYGQGALISPKGYTLAEGFWLNDMTVDTSGGRWQIVGASELAHWFALTASIKKDGAFRRAWVMLAFSQPNGKDRWLSLRLLQKFDCVNKRHQRITATPYSGSFGSGNVLGSGGETAWDYAAPGDIIHVAMKYVCDYDLTTKK